MTHDEIMLALRLTAMGRYGHPMQEQLATRLAQVFERVLGVTHGASEGAPQTDAAGELSEQPELAKRRPGRPKKAD